MSSKESSPKLSSVLRKRNYKEMSAEIMESEESAALQNARKSKTLAKSHQHVFMPNVSQNNQGKLLEPPY